MRDPQFSSDDPFIQAIPLRKNSGPDTPEALLGEAEPTLRRNPVAKLIALVALLFGAILVVLPI